MLSYARCRTGCPIGRGGTVLPESVNKIGCDNANSITLAVEYEGKRVLLPGDLESPGLDDVMAEMPYDCDVLLAPHHGSRRSDPPGFAAWSTPDWVVVSGGGGEPVRPVIGTYEHTGARVLVTNEVGAIMFTFQGDSPLRAATGRAFERRTGAFAFRP